ncbi:hypothetical protein Gotur_011604, partial [Gossypium turneri]
KEHKLKNREARDKRVSRSYQIKARR